MFGARKLGASARILAAVVLGLIGFGRIARSQEPEVAEPPPTEVPSAPEAPAMPPEVLRLINLRREAFEAAARDENPARSRSSAVFQTSMAMAALQARPFDDKVGFLALDEPYQYTHPPNGPWYLPVPPLPPLPPEPGKPNRPRPWAPLFYDNNWTYLEKLDNSYIDAYDFLKRVPLNKSGSIKFDFGGEFRWQFRGEANSRLSGKQNNFNLFRERLYVNAEITDRFRVFFETIWADSSRQNLEPLLIDINHGDLLNAFGEILLREDDSGGKLTASMAGRQELLFGNQRLVSPLEWGNTRRTFDTVPRLRYKSATFDFDAFWARPNVIERRKLDRPLDERQFFGAYAVWKDRPNRTLDLYYFGLLDSDKVFEGTDGTRGTQDVHTVGLRRQSGRDGLLLETELAYQFGRRADRPINAGMATAGAGWRFSDAFGKPEIWFFWDYASGSRSRRGSYATFNQLFPLGHKYFGFLDFVGRQNVSSPAIYVNWYPSKRLNFNFGYHYFELASATDALYNAAGLPTRVDPTGRSGRFIGNEWDLVANIVLNPHADLQLSWNIFDSGTLLDDSRRSGVSQLFYAMFMYRF